MSVNPRGVSAIVSPLLQACPKSWRYRLTGPRHRPERSAMRPERAAEKWERPGSTRLTQLHFEPSNANSVRTQSKGYRAASDDVTANHPPYAAGGCDTRVFLVDTGTAVRSAGGRRSERLAAPPASLRLRAHVEKSVHD